MAGVVNCPSCATTAGVMGCIMHGPLGVIQQPVVVSPYLSSQVAASVLRSTEERLAAKDADINRLTHALGIATVLASEAQEENERLRVLISEIDGICSDDASCLTVIGRRPCREIEAAITRFRDREAEQ